MKLIECCWSIVNGPFVNSALSATAGAVILIGAFAEYYWAILAQKKRTADLMREGGLPRPVALITFVVDETFSCLPGNKNLPQMRSCLVT